MNSLKVKKNFNRVIITGASGFIGFALVKKYLDLGYEVYALVRKNTSKMQLLNNDKLKVIYCDLEHVSLLDKKISVKGFDAFIHLAWQGVSNEDSRDINVQLANVRFSCDAIRTAKKIECQKFVFGASIMEYEVMKLMETELSADPRNIYRTAKIAAHYLTRIIASELAIEYNAAIISNVYGKGEISNRFINLTLRKMLKGEEIKFSAATQLYDFIYIDDAINMIVCIAEKGVNNRNYYIGSMKPRVLKDYIFDMRDCVNTSSELKFGESHEYVGISLNYDELDITAVYKDLNATPHYSFKEGIMCTIDWLKNIEDNI